MVELKAIDRRENLVKKLRDPDYRESYLHPKKRTRREVLKRLYKPVFENKKIVVAQVICAITGGLIPVLSAFIMRFIVESIQGLLSQNVSTVGEARSMLLSILVYCLLFFVLSAITIQIEMRTYSWFMNIRIESLGKAFHKMTKIELGLREDASFLNSVGDLSAAVGSNNSGMEGIYHEIFKIGKSVVATLILSIILARVNPLIPIIALVSIIINAYSRYSYSSYHHSLMPKFQEVGRKSSRVSNISMDFNYGKDVRVYKMRGAFENLANHLIKKNIKLQIKLRIKRLKTTIPVTIALVLIDLGIAAVLVVNYFDGRIDAAVLVMILSIVGIYSMQLKEIGRVIAYVYEESMYIDYLYDFLDASLSSKGGQDFPMELKNKVDIEFRDVWFRYPGSDNWVLEGLNLQIKTGESVALVGVNGAGKTTLISLLTGLYQPEKGQILIGGIDIASLSQDSLNKLIAVVLQEIEPIALTIAQNVAVSLGDIDKELVEESLKKAGLWGKIESYKNGIDSMMLRVVEDEGVVLSGGENQKLAIARALYRDSAEILVLDEPTSALDAIAEEQIYRDFESLIKDKTAIFISHRLASTRFCDRIILLNGGKIEQIGTHDELVSRPGLYKDMYDAQASYYKKEAADEDIDERKIFEEDYIEKGEGVSYG
ncbi:MAG: ABC transporter ATP-binding protein [Clostridiales bacterium]|nr:ABC transporter ATP-binding protein [Clostridiales bacterium]